MNVKIVSVASAGFESGSMIFQMLIGVLLALGIAIRVYWQKLKFKFSSRFSHEQKEH